MTEARRAALLGTDLMLASRLRTALSGEGVALTEATRDDLIPEVSLVFVDLNHEPDARVEAITRLHGRNPTATLVGFCDHGNKALILRAVAAGACQVVANRYLAEAAVRLLGGNAEPDPADDA